MTYWRTAGFLLLFALGSAVPHAHPDKHFAGGILFGLVWGVLIATSDWSWLQNWLEKTDQRS